jgi:hypothetical protein
MFGSKRWRQEARRRKEEDELRNYKAREAEGAEITKRISELRQIQDRTALTHAVTLLFKDAQHHTRLVRQSIADKVAHFSDGRTLGGGDIDTFLGEDLVDVIREGTTNPQTMWQALSEQLPDVNFSISWYDAASLAAAILRERHMHGVIQGLQLAGILPERWTAN